MSIAHCGAVSLRSTDSVSPPESRHSSLNRIHRGQVNSKHRAQNHCQPAPEDPACSFRTTPLNSREAKHSQAEWLPQLRRAGPNTQAPGAEARHTLLLPLGALGDNRKPGPGKECEKGPASTAVLSTGLPRQGQGDFGNHTLRKAHKGCEFCAQGPDKHFSYF